MANNQIFYDMATKEFIRTKSTNNTRVMTAPPSNNQWSMSIYMSIQDYFMLFFSELEKYSMTYYYYSYKIFYDSRW